MRASRPFLLALAAGWFVACAPAKPPSTPHTKPPSAPVAPPEEEAPDLSPVATPAGLLVAGRWRQPSATADTLLSWAKLPVNWRGLMTQSKSGVGSIVAVDAPVELAVVLPDSVGSRLPAAQFAFSVGLTSLEAGLAFAKAQGEEVQQLSPGVFRVGGESGLECAAAASVGTAPARLVCGEDFDDVERLVPFMTRGLPTLDLGGSDVHVELRLEPLRPLVRDLRQRGLAVVLNELSIDDARFDRALAEVTRGGLDELTSFTEDTERLSLDLQLERERGWATANIGVAFRSQKSWTVQNLIDMQKRSSPAPDWFWRLPADSGQASYMVPMDPARTAGIRRALTDLVENGLAHGQVPRRTRDEIVALLDELFAGTGPAVSASGSVAPDPALAPSAEKIRQLLGWTLVGYEAEPASRFTSAFDRLVGVYNDQQLRKLLTQRGVLDDATKLPKVSARAAAELPPKSKLYELSLPTALAELGTRPAAPAQRRPTVSTVSVFLAVVPVGKGTWIGVSVDKNTLFERLRSVEKAPPSATLAQRPGLEQLRQERSLAAGFTVLRAFVESLTNDTGIPRDRLMRALDGTPSKGKTPILTRVTLNNHAKGTELQLSARATQGTILDLAAALPTVFAGGLLDGLMSD